MLSYDKLYFKYKKLYSLYLDQLILILNNYHKKQYNKDYWEPIIGLYLRKFLINYLFLNHINKKKLFKKANYNNLNLNKSYSEFVDDRNYCYYKFEDVSRGKYYKIKKQNFLSYFINHIILFLPNILVKLGLTKVFFQESYFKKNFKNLFSLKSIMFFNSLPLLQLENFIVDKKNIFQNRLNLMKSCEMKYKKDYILQNIILSMPINYIENYDNIFNIVKRINSTNAIYIDGNEVKFDYVKFYIAKLISENKTILTGQHSLRTGLEDYDVYFDYTNSISNFYLTWGWNNHQKTVKKFSSLRIFSSLNKYKNFEKFSKYNFNICFILCSYSKIGECLHENYLENLKAEKERISLLDLLKKQKRFQITLKPRNGSFLISNKKNFYSKFNTLDDKARMYEVFGNYNIVFFERLSLGIVECIYLNQPTIFYYSKKLYQQKNKKYNELLSLLKKANIFFDDKKKIIQLLRSKQNISLWWFDKKNIKNRKIFLSKFARCFENRDLKLLKKLT